MLSFTFLNTKLCKSTSTSSLTAIKDDINIQTGIPTDCFYLVCNGKLLSDDNIPQYGSVQVVPRIYGGKGGFGSMLRAIGAQIEKTTNREACRDLSGRRLRDINEEKRLKKWIDQQAERAKEAEERKQKKLERLCEKPKYEFRDDEYDRLRSELPGVVEDSVTQGMKASASTKRKLPEATITKKRPKLWVDADLEELDSEDDSASDDDVPSVKSSVNDLSRDVNGGASCSSTSTSNLLTESKLGDDEMSRPSTSTASVCGSDSRECPSFEEKEEESSEKLEEATENPDGESPPENIEENDEESKIVNIL